ncbi:hypothetical protein JXI42_08055 [bacterium]|nr:hypothetical protein [bacterium]
MKRYLLIASLFPLVFLINCGKESLPPSGLEFDIKSQATTRGHAQDAFVSGDYLYVADGEAGITTMDISNPESIFVVGNLDYVEQDDARAIFIDSTYGLYMDERTKLPWVFLADWRSEYPMIMLRLDETGLPLFSPMVFWANRCSDVTGVTIRDSLYLFIADEDDGLLIANPTFEITASYTYLYINQIGEAMHPPSPLSGVCGTDEVVLLACGVVGVFLVDISNMDSIHFSGDIDTPGEAEKLDITGNYCYIADGYEGLSVIDFSNPDAPSFVTNIDPGYGYAQGIAISGDYAYLAAGSGGIYIFDISNPETPDLLDNIITPYAYGVTADEEYAYLCDRDWGVVVVGVEN